MVPQRARIFLISGQHFPSSRQRDVLEWSQVRRERPGEVQVQRENLFTEENIRVIRRDRG